MKKILLTPVLVLLLLTGCTSEIHQKTDESISTKDVQSDLEMMGVNVGESNEETVSEVKPKNETSTDINNPYSNNQLVSVEACNTSGYREPNVKVDIGYDSNYANREYYGYTNEYSQLVYVHADEIIIQNDDVENVTSSDRYCSDEAKVDGTESSSLDEGHAIADSLGGVSNAYNITPQESILNRSGDQSDMEETIRNAGENGINITNFNYYIYYDSNDTQIPSNYEVSYFINGVEYSDSFENSYTETVVEESPSTMSNDATTSDDVYYENCTAVRDAGADPITTGDPGYSSKLDRDGDGTACE